MTVPRRLSAPLLALALFTAAPAAADALQDRLTAAARAAPADLAFTRTARAQQTGEAAHTIVDRYDPSKPPAERWTLVSIDGKPPTADDIAKARDRYLKTPVPGYYRLARWIGAKAAPDASGRVYRYPALPKGILEINGRDLSADTAAEVTVGGGGAPFVERTHFVSTRGFRMMLVAKVDRVEASQSFRLLPDGRPVPNDSVIEMTGSMMGKAGTMRTVTTYSDWRVVK